MQMTKRELLKWLEAKRDWTLAELSYREDCSV